MYFKQIDWLIIFWSCYKTLLLDADRRSLKSSDVNVYHDETLILHIVRAVYGSIWPYDSSSMYKETTTTHFYNNIDFGISHNLPLPVILETVTH